MAIETKMAGGYNAQLYRYSR